VFRGDYGDIWGILGSSWGLGGLVWWVLGGILGQNGANLGSENGLKMGFWVGGRGVLRKWGFFGFSGV